MSTSGSGWLTTNTWVTATPMPVSFIAVPRNARFTP